MRREDEWIFGWDPAPGIVSVWAESNGIAHVFRRVPDTGQLIHEKEHFRPWVILDRLDDLTHLGDQLGHDDSDAPFRYRELEGPGALRFLVSAHDGRALSTAIARGATERTGVRVRGIRDLDDNSYLEL